MEQKIIHVDKRPSSLMTIFKAVKKRNIRFDQEKLQQQTTILRDTGIDRKHHASYCEVCHVPASETLSLLYPLTLIYPFNIRLICSENVPLVMFKMLNIHTTLISYRKLSVDDRVDISCTLSDYRIMGKGLEVDIKSTLTCRESLAWECTNTFYFRGKFSDAKEYVPKFFHERIETPDNVVEWVLPNKNGLKFAGISGDTNPLHYNMLYSKMMGFERDFAQPFLVAEKVMALLGKKAEERPVRVELFYKGQVYYGRKQAIKSINKGMATFFELFCEGNDRPSIHGSVSELP